MQSSKSWSALGFPPSTGWKFLSKMEDKQSQFVAFWIRMTPLFLCLNAQSGKEAEEQKVTSAYSVTYMWTFWPEQPEGKHGSQHVWNHISEELLKINWVCASNSILRWFFSIINISHTAQRWVKQITLLTTKWNKSRLTSEKTSQTCARCHYPALPHCHPLGSASHAKDIRCLCACERARKDRSKFPSPAWQYHCS